MKRLYHAVRIRRLRIKLAAVAYRGGKCEACGYDKNPWVLEFHHHDPTTKDFELSSKHYNKSWEAIKAELEKCALLCSNCHQEHHTALRSQWIDDALDTHLMQNAEMKQLISSIAQKVSAIG